MRIGLSLALILLAAGSFVASMVFLTRAADVASAYWLALGAASIGAANRMVATSAEPAS
jgi:hypothetical protein